MFNLYKESEHRGAHAALMHVCWGISKQTPHKSWHIKVILGRLETDFGPPYFACFLLFRKEPYIQSVIKVNVHQVKKQNCLGANEKFTA